MASAQVTSALVMGVLAAIVVAALARSRPWHSHRPAAATEGEAGWSPEAGEAGSGLSGPTLWIGLFLLLAVGAVAGVGVFVTSAAAPSGLLSGPIVVASALFVGVYMALGVYATAKQRGHPTSMAAAEMATVVGALFLLAVSSQLVGA